MQPVSPQTSLCEIAEHIHQKSIEYWGESRQVCLLGQSDAFLRSIGRLPLFASTDSPVLLIGESGVGKELFARAIYLLSSRFKKPFLSVNCAQYYEDNLTVSEFFGHKKGSFTGAMGHRDGLFREANGGVLFLDEIGELSLRAQGLLLRALSEGEIRPIGSNKPLFVDVRIVAATNRDLEAMVMKGTFREDLYYRLRCLRLHVPPLRERGADWEMLTTYFLHRLNQQYNTEKFFSRHAWKAMRQRTWRGNIRELRSFVNTAYCLTRGNEISVSALTEEAYPGILETAGKSRKDLYHAMLDEGKSFWEAVYEPFMNRDLNRAEVQKIIEKGLEMTNGSYKKMLPMFSLDADEYLKFMDFLRHHKLKPGKRQERAPEFSASKHAWAVD